MVYGSTECHIASECIYGQMHIHEENCEIKITKNNDLLLTIWDSYCMPIINYKIGDKIELNESESLCSCGNNTRIIRN